MKALCQVRKAHICSASSSIKSYLVEDFVFSYSSHITEKAWPKPVFPSGVL